VSVSGGRGVWQYTLQNMMLKTTALFAISLLITVSSLNPIIASEPSDENRILAVVKKMESTFKALQDYTCEVEQVFYREGVEDQRCRFKFYFKKDHKIRVDFFAPYPSLTILYGGGEKEATVIPLRFFPAMRFHFSIDNPRLRTIAGQRIDQTDMGYFIEFLLRNLEKVRQKEDEFHDEGDQIKFVLWANDYIGGKNLEKYQVSVTKKHWLPIRIERYSSEGLLLEITDIRNYEIDAHLEDKLFTP